MANTERDGDTIKVDLSNEPTITADNVVKVDFREDPNNENKEDAVQEQSTNEVPVRDKSEVSEEVRGGNEQETVEEITGETEQEEQQEESFQALEEITDEEETVEEVKEVSNEKPQETPKVELPEGIQKLMEFIEDTGGSIEDYVNLNLDLNSFDNLALLREYYKKTKPHLDADEVDFLLDDQFSYDEEVDDEGDIRRKKLALKEQVANAKQYLETQKSKYYQELKSGSKLTEQQREAIDFYTKYTSETKELQATQEKQAAVFKEKTDIVFNDKFKGFDFTVGDKKYRFNIKNTQEVKNTQSDINNLFKKFLTEDNVLGDAKGYHKSLFAAMNADAIASHFYEQGKSDALKQSIAKSKNVSMNPRQEHDLTNNTSGPKFRVLSGSNSNSFKFKIKK